MHITIHVQISRTNRVALRVIGYVGVSISLATLAITALILICFKYVIQLVVLTELHDNTVTPKFLLNFSLIMNGTFRSLWNMRNYVHIHLSLSLMAAQLVFVAGVDKTSNTVGVDVP